MHDSTKDLKRVDTAIFTKLIVDKYFIEQPDVK